MTDITIYPTPYEQQLLLDRAKQHGMTPSEFVTWLIAQSLTHTSVELQKLTG